MLRVENLSKSYGKRPRLVLCDISFEIKPHSFTAILGSSGAGKTTLMRSILQVTPPDKGRVWFQDKDLTSCSERELKQSRAKIATVAQQFNLVRRRTAVENCLAGRLSSIPLWRCLLGKFPPSLLLEAMTALERVKLLDVAFQKAEQLSGGEQQRVAIARALTQKACLILADEPVASLDPQTAHTVLSLLHSLCLQEGLTVICNLHQVELAKQYSHHILGIKQGRLILDTPTSDLTNKDIERIYNL